jgi:hypothetical protein
VAACKWQSVAEKQRRTDSKARQRSSDAHMTEHDKAWQRSSESREAEQQRSSRQVAGVGLTQVIFSHCQIETSISAKSFSAIVKSKHQFLFL